MKMNRRVLTGAVLLVMPLLVAACGSTSSEESEHPPAVVEHVKGSDQLRVVLTADAAKRIGVQTVTVKSGAGGDAVIPYAAVLYDPNGSTWTYTSPKPLVYQRQDIVIDRIEGDRATLKQGPSVGTAVVKVGATEIWGVEYGGISED